MCHLASCQNEISVSNKNVCNVCCKVCDVCIKKTVLGYLEPVPSKPGHNNQKFVKIEFKVDVTIPFKLETQMNTESAIRVSHFIVRDVAHTVSIT